jgi:hypothetical protein
MGSNSVNWTPHGGCEDEEPPDAEWAHIKCWNDVSEKRRQSIFNEAWIKPQIRIDESQEYLNELRQINRERERKA